MGSERKLNLGCGEFKKKGYINLDYYSVSAPDVKHDLNRFPYPFKDNYFDLVEADHVLEHLDDPFRVMREIHRICKNNARVKIKVPHFSRGFMHPEHKRGFDVSFPLYFDPKFLGGYQNVRFDLVKLRLSWMSMIVRLYMRKKLWLPLYSILFLHNKFISFLANLSPGFCSRCWCFWVGGFDEIAFEFTVKK